MASLNKTVTKTSDQGKSEWRVDDEKLRAREKSWQDEGTESFEHNADSEFDHLIPASERLEPDALVDDGALADLSECKKVVSSTILAQVFAIGRAHSANK